MGLLNRQLRALSLAGTVGLPAPFPAVGLLYLVLDEDNLGGMEQEEAEGRESYLPESGVGEETLVKIVHEATPRITIVRYVRFSDISAVFLPDDPSKVDFHKGTWYLENDLLALALGCLMETGERGGGQEAPQEVYLTARPGIVFVPEAAKVLLQVEQGMTAAESAEYYPPQKYGRGHGHAPAPGHHEPYRMSFCDP